MLTFESRTIHRVHFMKPNYVYHLNIKSAFVFLNSLPTPKKSICQLNVLHYHREYRVEPKYPSRLQIYRSTSRGDLYMLLTMWCWTRYRIVSRTPEDTRFEVNPRNTLHLTDSLNTGSLSSSLQSSVGHSSESLQSSFNTSKQKTKYKIQILEKLLKPLM